MRFRIHIVVGTVVGATVLSSAGLALATLQIANASTLSPFDPPAPVSAEGNGATEGTLQFYDDGGNVITTGASDVPPAYVKAMTDTGRDGDDQATLYAATPQKGVNPGLWPNQQISVGTNYPLTSGAPAGLLNQAQAINDSVFQWFGGTDGYQLDFPNSNDDTAWQNLYQLRLYTSGPGQSLDSARYASATILLSGDTWTQVYPDPGGEAPVVSSSAAVTGTAKVGSTVTCSATFTGADSVTYSWLRDDVALTATTSTYKPVAADVGKALKCTATGTNTSGSTPSTSSAVTVAEGDALENTSRPTVNGKPKVGKTLTCDAGAWQPKASSYRFQWLRNGDDIKKATAQKYKLVAKDGGKKLACEVTALKSGYASGSAKSGSVKVKR